MTLGDETHGIELRWLELFERKLREERGTPAAPPPRRRRPSPRATAALDLGAPAYPTVRASTSVAAIDEVAVRESTLMVCGAA